MFDAVIVSDVHLGAPVAQADRFAAFLAGLPPTRRLVVNGDLIEGPNRWLTRRHRRVLSLLASLSDRLELVWVAGNHDGWAVTTARSVGASFVPEYAFVSAARRVLCVHGHGWDDFLYRHPIWTRLADKSYRLLQDVSHGMARLAKQASKAVLGCGHKQRDAAVAHAERGRFDAVCCGHTHRAEAPAATDACGPLYYNSGCWADRHCHFLTVAAGAVGLHAYTGRPVADAAAVDS